MASRVGKIKENGKDRRQRAPNLNVIFLCSFDGIADCEVCYRVMAVVCHLVPGDPFRRWREDRERSGLIIQNPGFLETPHKGTDRFTAFSKDIPRLYPPRGRLLSRPPCLNASSIVVWHSWASDIVLRSSPLLLTDMQSSISSLMFFSWPI